MKKIIILASFVLVLAISYFVLAQKKPESPLAEPTTTKPIKIGVILPLTGIVATFGEEAKRGIEAARQNGVEIIYEDDQCDPKLAVAAFKKLTELDGVNVIIGPTCGSPQEVVAPLAKDKGVLLLLPAAASSHLFEVSGGSMYNTQYSLEEESTFNARKLSDLDYKRIALISYPNSFSKAHAEAFRKSFTGTIVSDVVLPAEGSVPQIEMTKLSKRKFDAIYVTDISFYFGDGVKKLTQAGIKAPLFSTYVVELPMVRSLVGETIYSFPSDITDGKGGVYGLAKETLDLLSPIASSCDSSYSCMKKKLIATGKFDENGTSNRSITLKQIKNGEPVMYLK